MTINKNGSSNRININFANPILNNIKIVQILNNKLVSKFLVKLTNYINNLKKISFSIHEITKTSIVKGNYHDFLDKFIYLLDSSNFHNYFFSLVKKANKLFEEKNYEKAYKEILIAEYICECINNQELIRKLDDIFAEEKQNNKIEISIKKISEYKKKYILISFLSALFRYFKNSMNINQYHLQQNKNALDGLMSFYPSLMKFFVDIKKNLK